MLKRKALRRNDSIGPCHAMCSIVLSCRQFRTRTQSTRRTTSANRKGACIVKVARAVLFLVDAKEHSLSLPHNTTENRNRLLQFLHIGQRNTRSLAPIVQVVARSARNSGFNKAATHEATANFSGFKAQVGDVVPCSRILQQNKDFHLKEEQNHKLAMSPAAPNRPLPGFLQSGRVLSAT